MSEIAEKEKKSSKRNRLMQYTHCGLLSLFNPTRLSCKRTRRFKHIPPLLTYIGSISHTFSSSTACQSDNNIYSLNGWMFRFHVHNYKGTSNNNKHIITHAVYLSRNVFVFCECFGRFTLGPHRPVNVQ